MCINLFPSFSVIRFLPFIFLLLMPIYGAIYGKYTVIRFALLILVHTLVSHYVRLTEFAQFLNQHLSCLVDLVQFAVLAVVFAVQPAFLLELFVWLCDWLLLISEPLWLVAEVYALVAVCVTLSQLVLDEVDDAPSLAKGVILFASGIFYVVSVVMLFNLALYLNILWYTVFLLVVFLLHYVALTNDKGVISDAAFVTMTCTVLLSAALANTHSNNPAEMQPYIYLDSPHKSYENASYVELLVRIPLSRLTSIDHGWQFFAQLCNVAFLTAIGVRLFSALYTICDLHTALMSSDDVETERMYTLLDGSDTDGTLSLFVRLTALLVYTQFVVHHVAYCADGDCVLPATSLPFPIGRCLQIPVVIGLYLYHLHATGDSDK